MERLSSYPQRVKEMINKSKTRLQEGLLLLPSCICALHGGAIRNIKKYTLVYYDTFPAEMIKCLTVTNLQQYSNKWK